MSSESDGFLTAAHAIEFLYRSPCFGGVDLKSQTLEFVFGEIVQLEIVINPDTDN